MRAEHPRVHRIPHPTFRDDREAPLGIGRRDEAKIIMVFRKTEAEYFLQWRLTFSDKEKSFPSKGEAICPTGRRQSLGRTPSISSILTWWWRLDHLGERFSIVEEPG